MTTFASCGGSGADGRRSEAARVADDTPAVRTFDRIEGSRAPDRFEDEAPPESLAARPDDYDPNDLTLAQSGTCLPDDELPVLEDWMAAPSLASLRAHVSSRDVRDARSFLKRHFTSAEGLSQLPPPTVRARTDEEFWQAWADSEDGRFPDDLDSKTELRQLGYCNSGVRRELSVSLLAEGLADGQATGEWTSMARAERFGSSSLYYADRDRRDPLHAFVRSLDRNFNSDLTGTITGLFQNWSWIASEDYCLDSLGLRNQEMLTHSFHLILGTLDDWRWAPQLVAAMERVGYSEQEFEAAMEECRVAVIPYRFEYPIDSRVLQVILIEDLTIIIQDWLDAHPDWIPSNLVVVQ